MFDLLGSMWLQFSIYIVQSIFGWLFIGDFDMAQIPIEQRAIVPQTIFDVENYYKSPSPTRRLAWPTNEIYLKILEDAKARGIGYPWFRLISGYRDLATQQRLWDRHPTKDRSVIAPPGRSSHHTGHTMDIFVGAKGGYSPTSSASENVSHMRSQREYQIFKNEIAPKYGLWELSSEPWHWECDRECRKTYLMSEYQIPESLAQSIVTEQVHIPNGDLVAFIEEHGVTRVANDPQKEGLGGFGKVLVGTAIVSVVSYLLYTVLEEA